MLDWRFHDLKSGGVTRRFFMESGPQGF